MGYMSAKEMRAANLQYWQQQQIKKRREIGGEKYDQQMLESIETYLDNIRRNADRVDHLIDLWRLSKGEEVWKLLRQGPSY